MQIMLIVGGVEQKVRLRDNANVEEITRRLQESMGHGGPVTFAQEGGDGDVYLSGRHLAAFWLIPPGPTSAVF